ncbi:MULTISPECIES: hypothetical protein [unclassified Synechococcus]|uniref:hypothetical protein n=2 Tax=Synechococcus TaxID=1129 RepID=UPI001C216573|nr:MULTISPECIES: hypothetical protein [unclassified Synechococcus]
MLSKSMLQAVYLLAAVLAACLGQFILRIRPPAEGVRTGAIYLAASLVCYGASFGITALVLPGVDRKLAVLVLSLQYPLLYVFFSLKDAAPVAPANILAITLGYGIVALGMAGR